MFDEQTVPRRAGLVLGIVLLVGLAGCAGFADDSGEEPTTNGTQQSDPGDRNVTETPTDGQGEQTSEPTQTTTTTAPGTDEPGTGDSGSNESRAVASGGLAVVVDDERVALSAANESAPVWFADESSWATSEEQPTLAAALETANLSVADGGDRVTYEGTTYRGNESNVTVVVRANGEPVDPGEYELSDGDQVWIEVLTAPVDQPTPGDHIDHHDLHAHGHVEMVVDGEPVNFSRARYQTPDEHTYFHFESGSAPRWHAHSWSVTLEYAMGTFPGIEVTNDSITYNGTTYDRSDPGTTVSITVNDEPVEPGSYYLKDGDSVHIEVTTNGEEDEG